MHSCQIRQQVFVGCSFQNSYGSGEEQPERHCLKPAGRLVDHQLGIHFHGKTDRGNLSCT